ncbi:MAG: mercuric ion transport protein [Flavobacteriales bacterium]|jgi:mercuric ion transport protein
MKDRSKFSFFRTSEGASIFSIVLATLACSSCFPALASIGAALGMGAFSPWEGTIVKIVIPSLAMLTIFLQVIGWYSHKDWRRVVLGVVGPVGIFVAFVLFSVDQRVVYLYYFSIVFMISVAVFDVVCLARNRSQVKTSCCPTE